MNADQKKCQEGSFARKKTDTRAAKSLDRLLQIMAVLRDPVLGCAWDRRQTFATIAPYTIEEAYEVADAIDRNATDDLKEELGDLLFQVAFHARMAEEAGLFAFADVADAISEKMTRRHPHIFAPAGRSGVDAESQWEEMKQAEREKKAARTGDLSTSIFNGIPAGLPALLRSAKLQQRASAIGFDWPSLMPILHKVEEEFQELRAEIEDDSDPGRLHRQREEFGDLLFVLVNLGLRLGIDADAALRAANAKFIRRLDLMEAEARQAGRTLKGMTLDEMQVLWDRAKAFKGDFED